MSEERVTYLTDGATIDDTCYVKVYRDDLEAEHSILIARVNQIREKLGYPPLLTGKQLRRQQGR